MTQSTLVLGSQPALDLKLGGRRYKDMQQEATLKLSLPKERMESFQNLCASLRTSPTEVLRTMVDDFLRTNQNQKEKPESLDAYLSRGEIPPGVPNELAFLKALIGPVPKENEDLWDEEPPQWKHKEVFE